MLTSITLRNFKSFGEEQTIPLQPITVLVGPNNSGKSNLVSLGRFVRNAVMGGAESAFKEEGGAGFVFHRPALPDSLDLSISWKKDAGSSEEGTYSTKSSWDRVHSTVLQEEEYIELSGKGEAPYFASKQPFGGLGEAVERAEDYAPYRPVWAPMVHSKEIKLSLLELRRDARVVLEPELGVDGSGMPAVLGLWRGANLDRARELDEFVHKCLPEIKHVLAKPGPNPGEQRLWIQQADGEQFDAAHVSDGVLCFIALAMHAIEAEPGALMFIEEPEQSIHPRRLGELVNLFRRIVYERKCQIIVATHSPVLLNEFRDEPEAILLFRRGESGTRVKPLTEFPALVEALHEAEPGEMLANGFFNEPF